MKQQTTQDKKQNAMRYALCAMLFAFLLCHCDIIYSYDLDFSTYLGGTSWEHARDVFVDNQGYVYVVGGTASADFPTTPGLDRTFDNTGTQIGSGGYCEAFITKFHPNGSLVWSTFLGGPNYDRAYAIEADNKGYIYVAGRAGPGFPTTPGVFQETFQGVNAGIYGMQNAFVAKLNADTGSLVWASYVGVGPLCRDLAIDSSGDIYVPLVYNGTGGNLPSSWFANAFQPTRKGGIECGAVKIKNDGSQVLWATWLGGSGDDSSAASIRVDNQKCVYLGLSTDSNDIPTTPAAYDRTYSGDGLVDFYVAKLSPDGSNLEFGTYLGGTGHQWISTHNLAVDKNGNAYVAVPTGSDYPVTSGAFQTVHAGGNDWGVSKINSTGGLVASTFIGGNSSENPDGIYVDMAGNVYISGQTDSTNFPVTSNAYQSTNNGQDDAVLLILSSDFSQLLYSTHIGGSAIDAGRAGFLGPDGSLYVVGQSHGSGWPAVNAFQPSFAGGSVDAIVAKFSADSLLLGDISGNGEISAYDASLAARYASGLISLTPEQITRADVDKNGFVSYVDATLIARKAVDPTSGIYQKYPGNPIANLAESIPGMTAFSDPSILYDNGKYHLWFPCNDGEVSQICYATSSDGFQWTCHPEPVLKLGSSGSWDDYNCDTPTVIKDGTTYKMWYSGYTRTEPRHYKNIGYATSPDGINWTRLPADESPYGIEGVVFVLNGTTQGEIGAIADPEVVKVNNIYHMWYNGFGNNMIAISHATSQDGINWMRDPLNPVITGSKPWEMLKYKQGAVNQPAVLWNGENFEMWYGSFADQYLRYSAISHAVSQDGSTWIKDDKPALVPGPEDLWPSATAIRTGGKLRLYYIGFPKLGDPPQLYLATSTEDKN